MDFNRPSGEASAATFLTWTPRLAAAEIRKHTSEETCAVRVRVRRPRMEECVVSLLPTFPRRLYGLYLASALLQAGPGLASNRPLSSEATLVANLTMLGRTTNGWRNNGKVVRSRLSQVAQLRSLFCSDRLDGR